MSNLLSRLAARAIGERPAATSRLRAPGDEPRTGDAEDALERRDDVSATPAGSVPGPRLVPGAGATPSAPPTGELVPGRGATASAAPTGGLTPAAAPVEGATARGAFRSQGQPPATELLDTVDRLLSPVPADLAGRDPADALVEAVPGRKRHEGSEPPPAAASVALAMPAPTSETAVHASADPVAVRAEPEAVRVHIGRLEVRANLTPPAPPRPQAPRRRDELTLTDYLRGRR